MSLSKFVDDAYAPVSIDHLGVGMASKAVAESATEKVENFMGAPNYKLDPFTELMFAACSRFLGSDGYYQMSGVPKTDVKEKEEPHGHIPLEEIMRRLIISTAGKSHYEVICEAFNKCLDTDFEKAIKLLPVIRNEYMMRNTPQLLFVLAQMHKDRAEFNRKNPKVMREVASKVLMLPTDIKTQMQYFAALKHADLIQMAAEEKKKFEEEQKKQFEERNKMIEADKLAKKEKEAKADKRVIIKPVPKKEVEKVEATNYYSALAPESVAFPPLPSTRGEAVTEVSDMKKDEVDDTDKRSWTEVVRSKKRSVKSTKVTEVKEDKKTIIMKTNTKETKLALGGKLPKDTKKGLYGILKRCWRDALIRTGRYQVNKYSKMGNMVDITRLCHAKSKDNKALDQLMKTGKVEVNESQQTWENLRSQGKTWIETVNALGRLPHMAALRNLRGIAGEISDSKEDLEFLQKVINDLITGVPDGKQFPFRYLTAAKEIDKLSEEDEKIPEKPSDIAKPIVKSRGRRRRTVAKPAVVRFKQGMIWVAKKDGKGYFRKPHKAISATKKDMMKKGLNACLEKAIENYPVLEGNVVSLCDNSGSAHGAFTSEYGSVVVANIANISAVLTAKCCTGEGWVVAFGDQALIKKIDKNRGVLEQVAEIEAHCGRLHEGTNTKDIDSFYIESDGTITNPSGKVISGGTENGIWLFFHQALKLQEERIKGVELKEQDNLPYMSPNKLPTKFDHVFVYSDMQCGHGGLYGANNAPNFEEFYCNEKAGIYHTPYINALKLIDRYREKVSKKVNCYLVQVAGYKDSIAPQFMYRTVNLTGWTGREVLFAQKLGKIWDGFDLAMGK
jgi:hypothetical protein